MTSSNNSAGIHKSLFESSIDGIIVINNRGIIQDANKAILELMGYQEEEVIGKNVSILMDTPHREQHDQYLNRYQETREAKIIGIGREVEGRKKDGSGIPLRLAVSEFEADGQVFYTGVLHDLTEEKAIKKQLEEHTNELEDQVKKRTERLEKEIKLKEQAQSALMESQKLYEAIAVNFPNGTIGVLNRELDIVFMQGTELKEMGFDSRRLVGENYIDLLPEDVREEVKMHLSAVFEGEQKVFEINSDDKVYLGRSVPLPNEDGTIDKILQVDINITKEKQAEQEVYKALMKEKQLNEMKSKFVSMASHEFRTPLSSIQSSAALIRKYVDTHQQDKRERHIQKITSNVKNLNLILNDFLSLEKIEGGLIKNNPQHIQLKEYLEEILEETSPLKKADQEVETDYQHSTEYVNVDPFLLRNILNNLLSNAYKYSADKGTVKLTTGESKGVLTIAIHDDGIGISEAEQEQLFTRFFRASNATNIQGTGLGLNIVQRYATLMNAKIDFESKLDIGSTFFIRFTNYE